MRNLTLYKKYNATLSKSISDFLSGKSQELVDFTNEESAEIIRKTLTIDELRENGIFFTGNTLSIEACRKLTNITSKSKILDPTCGNGNLLVSILDKLPKKKSLRDTITIWGKILYGFDLFPEFIETAKLRIIREALKNCKIIDITDIIELKTLLSNIQQGNIFEQRNTLEIITHILMNPPFVYQKATTTWASGKINSAALIFDFCISNIQDSTQIAAILPNVLKSGTRYGKWRNRIGSMIENLELSFDTLFDKNTNVDVFILSGIKRMNINNHWPINEINNYSISSYFDISVGPYVPHRAKHEGKEFLYIKPLNIPIWKTINVNSIEKTVHFDGTVVQPPFLVIRRTSSPKDKNRASASIIVGRKDVVVENHLIICKPKDNTIETCQKLLNYLKSNYINDYLNKNIRCRHITVSILKEIPVGDIFNE